MTYRKTYPMLALLSLVILGPALAWANGAKGIATLVGGGATHARRAIAWHTLWTTLGRWVLTLPVVQPLFRR